ncbi:MAG: excisionase family DNA-binding protein [Candidatus Omnitrophica bacterium]|nr:excisionase family DNA-binding protein [Candidatus Omnitrophota bacterium]
MDRAGEDQIEPKLLTKAEAAAYLGVAERDLERLVALGQVPAYRVGGQFLRFRPEQLDGLKGVRLAEKLARLNALAPRMTLWARARDGALDFLYFNDFYLVSAVLAVVLLVIFARQQ